MALQLKKAGVRKVRPLEGGFEAWLKEDLPTEPVEAPIGHQVAATVKQAPDER